MTEPADPFDGLTREEQAQYARLHPTGWALYLSRYAGDGSWKNARHFDYLGDRVLEMFRGDLQRLCVSMPPGSGKSEYLSLTVASWWLANRPGARVVIASYGKDLAIGWSKRAKSALAQLGAEVFGVTAIEREKAAEWKVRDPDTGEPVSGVGYFMALGRGGPFTGKRAELLIIDDLLKDALEANSPAVRDAAWDWFDKVAMTRLLSGSCVIMIATRWHHDDPIGRLEDKQRRGEVELPWEFVNLPALALEDDPLGREPGETLWPALWPQERMEKIRQGRDPSTWSALFQGRPTPEGGGLFKVGEWLQSYRQEGPHLVCGELRVELERLRRFSTVDLAGSKKQRADWTVIATWGIDHATRTLWLLDLVRKRLEAPQIVEELRRVYKEQRPAAFYCEETGPQLNLVHALRIAEQAGETLDPAKVERDALLTRAAAAGLPVRKIKPQADKVTRSSQAQAVMSNGRMLFPERAAWLEELTDELAQFPEGKHDDQVDAVSYGAIVFLEVLLAGDLLDRRQREHNGPRLEQLPMA